MKALKTLILFLISMVAVKAQEALLSDIVNVSNDKNAYAITSIAIDPTNKLNMAIGTMKITNFDLKKFSHKVVSYISNDGGVSWKESILPKLENQSNSIAASVGYSSKGLLYFSHGFRVKGKRGSQILVHKSVDKGKTWSQSTVIETLSTDTPKMTIDQNDYIHISSYGVLKDLTLPSGARRKRVIIVASSSDQGKSFSIHSVKVDNELSLGVYNISVFSNNTLWLPISQFSSDREVNISNIYGINPSKRSILIAKSNHVTKLPRRIPRMANSAVDMSDRFKDRLYITYSDGAKDSLTTNLKFSKDRGEKWSEPRVLNVKNKGHFARLPRVAVSKKGIVGVSWLQTEDETGECWQMYFSYSKDGGVTFSEPIRISEEISCPSKIEALEGHTFLKRYYGFGGDYMGMDTTENGFQVVWMDLSSGQLQIYTRAVEIKE